MITNILVLNKENDIFPIRDTEILRELGYDVEYIPIHQRGFFKNILKLYKKAKKADILFSWWGISFTSVVLSKITGTPCIIVAGGGEIETDPILKTSKELGGYIKYPWYRKLIVKFTVNFADKLLLVSNYTKKNNYYKIVNFKKHHDEVVYNSIDVELFKPMNNIKKENYIFTTTYISRQHLFRKGLLQLLEVFQRIHKKYPDYKLIYLGNILEKDVIEIMITKIKELKLETSVMFKDMPISRKEYGELINRCKINVLYSYCDSFGVGMVEAMSCGVPVVVSNVMALPEIVGDAGLIADKDNITDFVNKIEMLINDENLYEELSKKGAERVRSKFSKEVRKENLKKIIEELTKK